MAQKLYSVKAYQYQEKNNESNIVSLEESKDKTPKTATRKLTIIGKDLTWQKAKELRAKYSSLGATIFPNVPEEKLKVIKLS